MSKKARSVSIPSTTAIALAVSLTAVGTAAQACPYEPLLGTVCYIATNYCPTGYVPANGQLLQVSSYQALFSLFGATYGGDGRTTFGVPDLRGRAVVGYNATTIVSGNTTISPINYGTLRGQETTTLSASNLPQHVHPATFTGTGGGSSGPLQASGSINVPVTVNVPAQNVSVSGSVNIANKTASGTTTVTDNAVLAKGGGQASIYAPSSTSADTAIGPTQTFSGSTTAATITASASGNVALPVTGSTGITGGTVAVGPNPTPNTPVANLPPEIGLSACVAVEGIWPSRP